MPVRASSLYACVDNQLCGVMCGYALHLVYVELLLFVLLFTFTLSPKKSLVHANQISPCRRRP